MTSRICYFRAGLWYQFSGTRFRRRFLIYVTCVTDINQHENRAACRIRLKKLLELEQEAQLSVTNRAMLFCKVVDVLQDVLSD